MTAKWNSMYGIDPDLFINDADRKAVEEKYFAFAGDSPGSKRRFAIRPPHWIMIVPFLPVVLVSFAGAAAVRLFALPNWTFFFVLIPAVLCLAWGSRWVCRRHFGPLFRHELRSRGYEICVGCGYWLQGLQKSASTCPECGKQIASELK